jgi:hypothetical protein
MRDPAARVNHTEADIEETCEFLKRYMPWKKAGEPDALVSYAQIAADEVEASNMPEWAKNVAIAALFRPAPKRRGRPRGSGGRNMAINVAAIRLVTRGYLPTRNDETVRRASASSIICEALHRLGEKITEKQINALVANLQDVVKADPDTQRFLHDVLK